MKIVAFGDSLTVGYISPFESIPYATYLRDLLPPDTSLQISAFSGEMTEEMLQRFERDVVRVAPQIVIILGGANDIGWRLPTHEIIDHLREMYTQAQKANIRPIACTVPSIIGADDFIPPRLALNQEICKEAERLQIPVVDLFTATADAQSRLLPAYSSDGLHLTPQGYEKMAQTIYETVFKNKN